MAPRARGSALAGKAGNQRCYRRGARDVILAMQTCEEEAPVP